VQTAPAVHVAAPGGVENEQMRMPRSGVAYGSVAQRRALVRDAPADREAVCAWAHVTDRKGRLDVDPVRPGARLRPEGAPPGPNFAVTWAGTHAAAPGPTRCPGRHARRRTTCLGTAFTAISHGLTSSPTPTTASRERDYASANVTSTRGADRTISA